ncbi:hypothetical protein BASA83_013172 [Batrachochytrium salamandrivorans]|nr:hypothetical protein BASA83_013172 [Batrachochytrium salamandrivorans]
MASDVDTRVTCKHIMFIIQNLELSLPWTKEEGAVCESITLVLLKRRDDSEGSSGDDSGSDSFLPSTSDPNEPFKSPFTDSNVSSMNLASTIDNVGDGNADLYKDGEKAGQKIGGPAGDMVKRYFRKNAYVNVALRHWVHESVPGILEKIKSLWGDDEYSRLEPDLKKDIKKWEDEFRAGLNAIVDATTNILEDVGSVAQNLQTIGRSFRRTLFNRVELLWKLMHLLRPFESSKALLGYLANIHVSSSKFYIEQQSIYVGIVRK